MSHYSMYLWIFRQALGSWTGGSLWSSLNNFSCSSVLKADGKSTGVPALGSTIQPRPCPHSQKYELLIEHIRCLPVNILIKQCHHTATRLVIHKTLRGGVPPNEGGFRLPSSPAWQPDNTNANHLVENLMPQGMTVPTESELPELPGQFVAEDRTGGIMVACHRRFASRSTAAEATLNHRITSRQAVNCHSPALVILNRLTASHPRSIKPARKSTKVIVSTVYAQDSEQKPRSQADPLAGQFVGHVKRLDDRGKAESVSQPTHRQVKGNSPPPVAATRTHLGGPAFLLREFKRVRHLS